MGNLSHFQGGQIVVARLVVSVNKTATFLVVSRAVSNVMTTYTNHGKTSSAKRSSGRKPKLSERNRHILKIMSKNQNCCNIHDIRSQYSS